MNTLRQFKRNLTGVYKRELLSLPLYLTLQKNLRNLYVYLHDIPI